MIRTCDATDPNLLDGPMSAAGPCACGLTFDDVQRSVIYPHVFLPTPADKARLAAWLDSVSIEEILTADPVALARLVSSARG
jgi:hypothetical protein